MYRDQEKANQYERSRGALNPAHEAAVPLVKGFGVTHNRDIGDDRGFAHERQGEQAADDRDQRPACERERTARHAGTGHENDETRRCSEDQRKPGQQMGRPPRRRLATDNFHRLLTGNAFPAGMNQATNDEKDAEDDQPCAATRIPLSPSPAMSPVRQAEKKGFLRMRWETAVRQSKEADRYDGDRLSPRLFQFHAASMFVEYVALR